MHVADVDVRPKSFDWTEWLVPGAISLLAHVGLVAFGVALHTSWKGSADLIKAEVLDIADSNGLKKTADPALEKQATREVSNREMVERLNLPMGLPRNMKCSVAVAVARDGQVLEAIVRQSTGNPEFDRSSIEAVYKSSPLPKPPADQLQGGVYRFELRLGE